MLRWMVRVLSALVLVAAAVTGVVALAGSPRHTSSTATDLSVATTTSTQVATTTSEPAGLGSVLDVCAILRHVQAVIDARNLAALGRAPRDVATDAYFEAERAAALDGRWVAFRAQVKAVADDLAGASYVSPPAPSYPVDMAAVNATCSSLP